jgi:mono/diheme cytochrome c family protein
MFLLNGEGVSININDLLNEKINKGMIKKRTPGQVLSATSLFFFFFIVFNTMFFRSLAQTSKWVAPKEANDLKNPLVASNNILADAKILYINNCSPCHGNKGHGDGPAASGLNPKPADHSSTAVQSETDGTLFWKLSEGRTPMPSYKNILTDEQRWELVTYIRSLAKVTKKK